MPLTTFGRYRVIRQIGSGGYGAVYLAEDPGLQRQVALKILSKPDAKSKQRFVREAITASKLSHPNLAVVYEAGETDDGTAFIAMQYVNGQTLRDRLATGPISIDETVRIAAQVADVLDEAHRHGIVHRDIKPGNIMIDDQGRVRVLDFGIAKEIEIDSLLSLDEENAPAETTAGMFLGTVQYVSPEQSRGDVVDQRSDIFSLGVVMYQMLTGANPFAAATFSETVRRIREVPPPPITRSDCPTELKRIVFRCVEKEPQRRYHTARELMFDLEGVRRPARKRNVWLAAAAVLTAALISAGVWIVTHRQSAPSTTSRINSIAVLPFVNFSPQRENEFIGDGISEEVLNALAQVGNLRVVSRTSSFTVKGTHDDARAIGQKLGVDALVSGSVQRAEERLRVTAQLIDTRDGLQLWSQTYTGAVGDVFNIEDQIARSVAAALQRRVSGVSLATPATRDITAYDLYLKARHEEEYTTRSNSEKAIAYYRAAIARDPAFADAYAGLAETYSLMDHRPGLTALAAPELYRLAMESANKALSLAPQSAEAHAALGHITLHLGEFAESRRQLDEALKINPNLSNALTWNAVLLHVNGRDDQTRQSCMRAREVDPVNSLVLHACSNVLAYGGDYVDAVEFAQKGTEIDPDYDNHYLNLASALEMQGRFAEAQRTLDALARVRPGPSLEVARASLLALSGQREAAATMLLRLEKNASGLPSVPMMKAWAAAGDLKQSMKWLDRAVATTRDYSRIGIDVPPHPAYAALRADPHYLAVRHELGLPARD
jgi:eukaryotic-like serine/threonine-protein kinase